MPTVQVHLPDDLYSAVKERDLSLSELLQSAVRAELRRQALIDEAGRHLDELIDEVGVPSAIAIDAATDLAARIKLDSAGVSDG